MTVKPFDQVLKVKRRGLYEHLPAQVVRIVDKHVDWEKVGNPTVLKEPPPFLSRPKVPHTLSLRKRGQVKCIIVPNRLNDMRYMNKFLETMNTRLKPNGYLIGNVETSGQRRQRQMAKFIWPFNLMVIMLDYLVFRVWPKLPYLKKIYFNLTRGRNRVLSEMETYGRLYSCGFHLLEACEAEGRLHFLAIKVREPYYNLHPTYGPMIHLNRIGKGGKPIKVYKFRTMYPYSEYLQQFVYERQGLQEGGKMKDDPRINAVGAFMRRYWIDELPMLYNLLNGDLKLFGVRPISPHYLSLYPKQYQDFRRRFKPGLIPPFYADLPKTLDEIVASEERYLKAYEKNPLTTDIRYIGKVFYNIFVRSARSF